MNDLPGIVQLGDARLRLLARPVTDFNAESANTLAAVLATTQGVGLAGPQIGMDQRMMVVASRPTPRYPNAPEMAPMLMLNPEFEPLTCQQVKDWEGCLSIPGIRAKVPRYTQIAVRYQDLAQTWHQATLAGFIARVFQHEYDHLQGIVYLDRISSSLDVISEVEYQRLF
ncbi:MAG: peptide deformylase [Methylococcales bacterium]|nr:peptide deformylase [Methylococcales bacterium]